MKNIFKRVMSIMLVFVMLFSFAQVGFAADANMESNYTTDNVIKNELNDAIDNEVDNEIVATLSVMCCMNVFPIAGHTWLYVENLSNKPIQVGHYTVPVGEGVSIGLYSFSSSDGWGLYYNLEAYRGNVKNNQANNWSITKPLNSSELNNVSNDIKNYTNYWGVYFNCAYFAFTIWNNNTDDFLIPLVLPAISQFEVILAGGKKGVLNMYAAREDQVFRQIGSRDDAYLVPATDSVNNT